MQTTRTEPKIKKGRVAVYVSLGLAFAAIAAIVPVMSTTAFAEAPDNPECWGTVTSQRADSDTGSVGEHSSDPDPTKETGTSGRETPRSGIGNLDFGTGDHPSDVGTFLAGEDDIDATECPEE